MMKYPTTVHVALNGEKSILTTMDWSTFRVEDVLPEINSLIAEGRILAEHTANIAEPTFNDLVLVWQEFNDRYSFVAGPMHHLNHVMQADHPGLRETVNKATPLMSEFSTDLAFHEGLYGAYVRFRNGAEYGSLRKDEQRIIDETIKEFELAGVGLSPEKKARLKEINTRSAMLRETFRNNAQDVRDAWEKYVLDKSELAGVPQDALERMNANAKKKGREGWLVTLQEPDAIAILEYAENRSLREEVYRGRVTKASDIDSFAGKRDNAPVISELVMLDEESAELLGFANYAELSLARKMARSAGVLGVTKFLTDLLLLARPKAAAELDAMCSFAKTELGMGELAPWDLTFVAEKLRRKKYAVDQEALRFYFPLSKVNEALSSLLRTLYGFTLVRNAEIKGWNDDVEYYELRDENGVLRAGCYIDLFAREGKRDGAWMDAPIERIRTSQGIRVPVAYIVCNFRKPPEGEEAYLTHEEVSGTYFHEFGHAIHHMADMQEYRALGMGGVEWDTVELPSQFMENFGWDRVTLKAMTRHKETGAQIPDAEIDKLFGAKYFNAGLFALRQLVFGIFDWEIYRDSERSTAVDANKHWQSVLDRFEVRPRVPYDRFPNTFGHIFAGGYSAGYFSYMWALGLAADAFAKFQESGNVRSREIGKQFLNEVLAQGSARPMAESFRAFRGRDLDPHALAKELGLIAE